MGKEESAISEARQSGNYKCTTLPSSVALPRDSQESLRFIYAQLRADNLIRLYRHPGVYTLV